MDNREIDKEIAEKVMGYVRKTKDIPENMDAWIAENREGRVFYPSTWIEHAWEVVEKMLGSSHFFNMGYDTEGKFYRITFSGDLPFTWDKSPSMAICLAALKTVRNGEQ